MRLQDKITEVQEKVVGSFEKKDKSKKVFNENFSKLQAADFSSLGENGKIVDNFFKSINNHPDIPFSLNEDFLSKTCKALEDETCREEWNKETNHFRSLQRIKARFIKDLDARKVARELKNRTDHVSLKQFYMLGNNGYYNYPETFSMYVRNNDFVSSEIKKLRKNYEVFKNHKLEDVARSVKNRMASMDQMDKYLGFYRMKPAEASVVSARMMNLMYHEWNFLTIDFNFFAQQYWLTPKREDDELKRLISSKDRKVAIAETTSFQYQPRLYALSKFLAMPKHVEKVLECVENMQETEGCPVFDCYWVLMPSININHPYFKIKNEWKVKTSDILTFNNEYEAAFALDKALVEDGHFIPVLLGERDNSCYFLTLWN